MIRLITILMTASLALPAHAWEPLSSCGGGASYTRWPAGDPNTDWRLSANYLIPSNQSISSAETEIIIQEAFDEWGNPGCSEFDAEQKPNGSGDPFGNSSNNLVGFYSNWPGNLGSTTLAITAPSWTGFSCHIGNADMIINADTTNWIDGNPPTWNQADLRSVITHEVGHWIGFDHSNYDGSSMTAYYSGNTAERTLTCNDTEGVCDLYDNNSNACTDNFYCPCGIACTNGICEGAGGDTDTDILDDDCEGKPETYEESEPNDWSNNHDLNWITSEGGDLTITGTISCGNAGGSWTEDPDWTVVDFPCVDQGRFILDWTSSSSDLDFFVWDAKSSETIIQSATGGMTGPLIETATTGGRLYFQVLCWEGNTTAYEMRVDWAPFDDDEPEPEPESEPEPEDDWDIDEDTSADDTSTNTSTIEDEKSCGCAASSKGAVGWPLVFGLFGLALRRRSQ